MDNKFHIKRGDTSPAIKYQIDLADGQTLVGVKSVTFKMALPNAAALKVDADGAADNVANVLSYAWVDGDTDTAGTYRAEFEVVYADDAVETWPNGGFLYVDVGEDL